MEKEVAGSTSATLKGGGCLGHGSCCLDKNSLSLWIEVSMLNTKMFRILLYVYYYYYIIVVPGYLTAYYN
jgi:hypothetical protein